MGDASAKVKGNEAVYKVVADRVIALLEQGTVPWRKPWCGPQGAPRNLVSGREYRGINILLLGCLGFDDPRFLSFKQALDAGGHVRKGERGFPIVFFKRIEDRRDAGKPADERRGFALLRYSTVFNVAQCEGLELPELPKAPVGGARDPITACEAISTEYRRDHAGPEVHGGRGQACYRPAGDVVEMPAFSSFISSEEFYSTLFHEFGHSTGIARRLDRKGVTDPINYASHAYSEEELVAEMTACFLCAEAGIAAATLDNSAGYIDHWLKRLRMEPRMLTAAAGQAQRAADHIRGRDKAAEDESEAA